MPRTDPLALNLAQVLYRLMTDPRGWRVDQLQSALEIRPRTYRKYRALLQDHFEHLFDHSGHTRVMEVRDGEARYLRLQVDAGAVEHQEGFLAYLTGHWFARKIFAFAGDTELRAGIEQSYYDFVDRIEDKPFWLGHVLKNADRMLYHVPSAPKDYTGQNEKIAISLRSLFHTRKLRFEYAAASREDGRPHIIHPLSLVHWRSGLYLVGLYEDDGRPYLFAMERINNPVMLDERFRYPSARDYDPETLFEGRFGIFAETGSEPTDVELVFAERKWLHRYLKERTWHPSQTFEDLPDGRLKMSFTVTSMVEVTPWLRQFGDDVKVIEPSDS